MLRAQQFPSLQQLRVFEAVAHVESISAAARTVNLSQPSVTQAIGHLETKVGADLFDRRRTGCYLSSAGRIFLARSTRMSAQIRQALCEPIVGPPFAERDGVTPIERKITDAQVRSLIAISESVSFDEAARRIGITEPSLHRSARTLERILRRTLYRRTAQGYTTTPPAAELARRFKVAAREIEYGMDEITAERGYFASRIIVGNIPHSNVHMLSDAINEVLAKFPDASVEVLDGHYDDLLTALRSGGVDIVYGVLRLPKWAVDVEEKFLFANHYAVVARRDHPLRALRRIAIPDLARYDWIVPPPGTPRRHAFEQMFKGYKSPPKVSVETTSSGIYRALLGASDRLSLFSSREVEADKAAGFEALPYRSPRLSRVDGIAIRKDWRPTRIHLEFLDRLTALAGKSR
jgi:LysR family transcriptional regulator, regulator for genes of the gallate degradation pathway